MVISPKDKTELDSAVKIIRIALSNFKDDENTCLGISLDKLFLKIDNEFVPFNPMFGGDKRVVFDDAISVIRRIIYEYKITDAYITIDNSNVQLVKNDVTLDS